MIDRRFVKLIEKRGYVNDHGKHIYGAAASLHVLHYLVKCIKSKYIELGHIYVQKYLST